MKRKIRTFSGGMKRRLGIAQAILHDPKVLIVDDLIATGGTTEAMIRLVESLGGQVVGVVVLMELKGLKGREKIAGYRLESAIRYEGN